MTAKAYLIGVGRGGSTPPSPSVDTCSWDDPFDQADFAAFRAQYENDGSVNGEFWFVNPDPPGSAITLSGSRLLLAGDGGAFGGIEFGRVPPSSGYLNVWMKIDGEMIGGAYVPQSGGAFSSDAVGVEFEGTGHVTFVFLDNTTTAAIKMDGGVSGFIGTSTPTAAMTNFPVGLWTVIACLSLSGTTLTAEYWVNPSPGDPPLATLSDSGFTDPIIGTFVQFSNPVTIGTTLAIDRVQFKCGSRASDPFGIL